MTRSSARMESHLERSVRFARLGFVVGLAGGVAFSGSIFVFSGRFVPFPLIGFPLGGLVGGFLISFFFIEVVGTLFDRATLGTRGASPSEYSDAQSIVARGRYQEALDRYRSHGEENPQDPRPYIRGARVLRDDLRDYAGAAAWLRRAQRRTLNAEAEITIARELVDVYVDRLDDPARALPELARIAERYQGTSAGDWAARTLARLRTRAWEAVRDDVDDGLTGYQRAITGREPPTNQDDDASEETG